MKSEKDALMALEHLDKPVFIIHHANALALYALHTAIDTFRPSSRHWRTADQRGCMPETGNRVTGRNTIYCIYVGVFQNMAPVEKHGLAKDTET